MGLGLGSGIGSGLGWLLKMFPSFRHPLCNTPILREIANGLPNPPPPSFQSHVCFVSSLRQTDHTLYISTCFLHLIKTRKHVLLTYLLSYHSSFDAGFSPRSGADCSLFIWGCYGSKGHLVYRVLCLFFFFFFSLSLSPSTSLLAKQPFTNVLLISQTTSPPT